MTELWVARDELNRVAMFNKEPNEVLHGWCAQAGLGFEFVPEEWFPDLQPGECRRLVLEEEKSE